MEWEVGGFSTRIFTVGKNTHATIYLNTRLNIASTFLV